MLVVTDHAARRLTDRRISLSWVDSTITDPEWIEPPQPGLVPSFCATAQAGGRVLRVVHRKSGDDVIVTTAMLDRNAMRSR